MSSLSFAYLIKIYGHGHVRCAHAQLVGLFFFLSTTPFSFGTSFPNIKLLMVRVSIIQAAKYVREKGNNVCFSINLTVKVSRLIFFFVSKFYISMCVSHHPLDFMCLCRDHTNDEMKRVRKNRTKKEI